MKSVNFQNDTCRCKSTSYIDQQTKASAKTSAINKELNIAHDIQMGLLKKPQLNQSNISVSSYIQPAKNIGGDFYDVIEKNNIIYFAIGDVSGKGIPAALIASAAITSLRSTLHFLNDPEDIVTAVNKQISLNNQI